MIGQTTAHLQKTHGHIVLYLQRTLLCIKHFGPVDLHKGKTVKQKPRFH